MLNARSDVLASMCEVVGDRPELRHVVGPLERFVFIVDTNRVLSDLGWLVARRRDPSARTAIQELHASGVAAFFAPEQLVDEVEEHLPEIARHYKASTEALLAAWLEYRAIIHFIPAAHLGRGDPGARDPKDVPFLAAKEAIGARAIISKDKDIAAMAGLMVAHETLRMAVGYIRHSANAIQGRAALSGGVMIVGGLGYGAVVGTIALVRSYLRLPRWLKVAIPMALVVSAAVVALHPGARRRIREALQGLKSKWPELKARAGEGFEQFFAELNSAEAGARSALAVVKEHVPAERRGPTLRQLAYRVCVAAGGPVSVSEITARLRREGYESQAKRPEDYLRRLLRADDRFRETPAGWDLTARAAGPETKMLAS